MGEPIKPLLTEEEIAAVTKHGALHAAGLCRCAIYDVLMKVAKEWPIHMAASRIIGQIEQARS